MKYAKGKIVTGCVTGIESYGIFVGLDEYYSGLIHISEVSNNFVRNLNDYVNVGETIKVKVLDCDEETCQVKLSIKDIEYRKGEKRRSKIVETKNGFSTLEKSLPRWMEMKSQELTENTRV